MKLFTPGVYMLALGGVFYLPFKYLAGIIVLGVLAAVLITIAQRQKPKPNL